MGGMLPPGNLHNPDAKTPRSATRRRYRRMKSGSGLRSWPAPLVRRLYIKKVQGPMPEVNR